MEGYYQGEELRTLTDLDETGFNSKGRLIQQEISKREEGMTAADNKKREVLARLADALVDDILAATDEEILA